MPANPLTLREREEIRYGIGRGEKATEIADRLGRHRCTISAEIARSGGRDDYRAYRAHDRAKACRARPKAPLLERCPARAGHVGCRLEAKDSPMTIAGELARGVYPDIDQTVSNETIYRAIYDLHSRALPRDVFRCLHRRHRVRVGRTSRRTRQAWRETMPSISERPAVAEPRTAVGPLEGDLIIGSDPRPALITVFHRNHRPLWMAPLPHGRTG